MPKVSIIIPCYNVENYIRQCLDSIVKQTLHDIEIICINDGSTDSTLDILREYEKNDNRIKVISKHNSGYGASMNIGLEVATGEYIGIVESDDFVELNMFETLYSEAQKYNLDLVRCQYYQYKSENDTVILCDNSWILQNEIYCPLDNNVPFYQAPAIWSNLYRKDLITLNNIKFLETPGASYQDTSFAFKVYACAKKFKMISNPLLYYRIDNESSSVNSGEKSGSVIKEYAEIVRFAKEKNIYNKVRTLIPKIKYACYVWNYNRLIPDLKYDFLKKMSKEYLKDILSGNIKWNLFLSSVRKKILIIAFFPWVYKNKENL